jgi:ribonuclease D
MDSYESPSKKRRTSPIGDKVEQSPNSLAACKICRQKITKGETRIGKEVWYAPMNCYNHAYYHKNCFDQSHQTLKLPSGKSVEDDLAKQHKKQVEDDVLVAQRSDLSQALCRLRSAFASRLERPHYTIFHDTVLRQLVLQMPKNKYELMDINGIKEGKYQSFGEPILQVIRHFRLKYARQQQKESQRSTVAATSTPLSTAAAAASTPSKTPAIDGDEDESDDVVETETLSAEEIVRRKFEHAKANNYMITVDF